VIVICRFYLTNVELSAFTFFAYVGIRDLQKVVPLNVFLHSTIFKVIMGIHSPRISSIYTFKSK